VTLTFDILTLKVVSESRVTWATSVPILVFLDRPVLELRPMYATDRRQTKASLNASAYYGRGIINGTGTDWLIKVSQGGFGFMLVAAVYSIVRQTVLPKTERAQTHFQNFVGIWTAGDRVRLNSFLRRCWKLGYSNRSITFEDMCAEADEQLFDRLINDTNHVLHRLLPPHTTASQHILQLPEHSTRLSDSNFLVRMLYRLLIEFIIKLCALFLYLVVIDQYFF